jgi:hypothetical protein
MRNWHGNLSPFGSWHTGKKTARIITAIVQPALAPLVAGDTIEDNLSADIDQTSNYASTAGTITSVTVTATINGVAADLTDTVAFEDVVAITVTVTDSEANVRVFSLGRTVAGIAPSNDVAPSIAGDTGLGDTLTVTAGTWSGVPAPTLAYQWLRGGVEIAGETGTTYVITLADSGASITVRETATNSEGSAFEVSNAITADTFTAPVNAVAPSISGNTDLGATLTRTEGTWSGNPTPTLSGQWQRDGVAIAGETGATYVIALADNGAAITYLQTATNAVGSASQVSNTITADNFTVPDTFTTPDWDVANDGDTVSVNILTLPNDGGAPITDLEYRVNGGAAISLGETTTGSYPITADEGDDIEIRAVNAIGAGDWSDVKAVPSGAFDPITLFASGEQGAWYDPSDLSTMFTDTAGTTPATVGDSVARINDKSGRGNHATQDIFSRRPILRQDSGGKYYLDFDGVDDGLVAFGMSIAGEGSWDILYAYKPLARNWILISLEGVATNWACIGQSGGSGNLIDRGSVNAVYFDNVLLNSPTRNNSYTTSQTANVTHWAVTFSSMQLLTDLSIGRYNNGIGFTTPGDVFGIVIRKGVLNTDQRTDLSTYLANKTGITI